MNPPPSPRPPDSPPGTQQRHRTSTSLTHRSSSRRKTSSSLHYHHHSANLIPASQHQFQKAVVGETLLILLGLALALSRLTTIKSVGPDRQIPTTLLSTLIALFALISGLRHWFEARHGISIPFRVPFTDHRGYRDQTMTDDGFSVAFGLPLLVSSAVLYSTLRDGIDNQDYVFGNERTANLVQLWNDRTTVGKPAHKLVFTPVDFVQRLSEARLDLLCFTTVNLMSLVLDLAVSYLTKRLAYQPIENSTRLIGSFLKSSTTALLFGIALSFGWLGESIKQSMTGFECIFSVFTFQSSFYLTSRLSRRGFTLGEASIFTSTGIALMLEVIRLTSARIRYSNYLKTVDLYQHILTPRDRLNFIPGLFRYPSPVIAIQHVLVSGIFLIGFILAPLLIWSRALGQRPTKRSRMISRTVKPLSNLHNNLSPSPPFTTPGTNQLNDDQSSYYRRFSNPDEDHHSRQCQTESKEQLRKILALSIYASIIWISLVVLSHWLGWLFEIGRGRKKNLEQSVYGDHPGRFWWRKVLGPGWVWFGTYCFTTKSSRTNTEGVLEIEWMRIGILVYWMVCLLIGIGGWTTHLVRQRRVKMMNSWKSMMSQSNGTIKAVGTTSSVGGNKEKNKSGGSSGSKLEREESSGKAAMMKSVIPNVKLEGISTPVSVVLNQISNNLMVVGGGGHSHHHDGLLAGEQRSNNGKSGTKKAKKELNLRRKFFHGLASLMFIPAIMIDPEFCSISFTVAFVIFTFAEFARYFALWPIGAGIHVFFNEFIDSKDSGPVILSHFYLLTSCASGLWLEGEHEGILNVRGLRNPIDDGHHMGSSLDGHRKSSSKIGHLIGVLILGIGDSLASIIGKRYGKIKWMESNKTVEGTIVFMVSLFGMAWTMRAIGLVEDFSMRRFLVGTICSGLLEAVTNQNDNLIISLYCWSLLKLMGV